VTGSVNPSKTNAPAAVQLLEGGNMRRSARLRGLYADKRRHCYLFDNLHQLDTAPSCAPAEAAVGADLLAAADWCVGLLRGCWEVGLQGSAGVCRGRQGSAGVCRGLQGSAGVGRGRQGSAGASVQPGGVCTLVGCGLNGCRCGWTEAPLLCPGVLKPHNCCPSSRMHGLLTCC
jgi:hypothetical protein